MGTRPFISTCSRVSSHLFPDNRHGSPVREADGCVNPTGQMGKLRLREAEWLAPGGLAHGEWLLELGSEVPQSRQEVGQGLGATSVSNSPSSGCPLSRPVTPPELDKAVLELGDGLQVGQQKTEGVFPLGRARVRGASWGRDDPGRGTCTGPSSQGLHWRPPDQWTGQSRLSSPSSSPQVTADPGLG